MLDDEPLLFIAQINLEHVRPYQVLPDLPATGILAFFAELDDPGQGAYELVECGRGRVLWSRGKLSPSDLPLKIPKFHECGLGMTLEPTLPPFESPQVDALGLPASRRYEIWTSINNAAEALATPFGGLQTVHRIGGFPHLVQGALHEYCPRQTKDWQLLLQLDSDPTTGAMWGDVGALYFMLRPEQLAAAEFESAYMVEQCC